MNIGPLSPQHDLWHQYLRMLVPHDRSVTSIESIQVPQPIAPWGPVIETILVAFSSVIIVLAILWLMWQTISSVVNAAWSGEAVTREWHSVWGPMRIVLGLGLIAPVANGNNLAQIGVIQISSWSGQAANTIYNAMLSGMTGSAATEARLLASEDEISQYVRIVSIIDICSRSVRYGLAEGVSSRWAARNAERVLDGTKPVVSTKRDTNGVSLNGELNCPGLQIDYAEPHRGWFTRQLDVFRGNRQVDMKQEVQKAWQNALNDIAVGFQPIGADLLRSTLGAMSTNVDVETLVDRYREWENQSIRRWREAADETSRIIKQYMVDNINQQQAEQMGWLGAPAIIFHRTSIMREAWAATNIRPSMTRIAEFRAGMESPAERALYARYDQIVTLLGPEISSSLSAARRQSIEDGRASLNLSMSETTETAMSWGMIPRVDIRTGSPLMQTVDWGFSLMESGTGVLAVGLGTRVIGSVVGSFAGAASSVPGVGASGHIVNMLGKVLGTVSAIAMFVGGIMILAGIVHAYVLPMLPVIIFIVFALGCLILVVESLIAAPLWALGHVKLAGHGMVDQTQLPGYHILLNLFVRIPIAMMAFVFSLLATDVGLHGVSQLIGMGFGNLSPFSGGVGPFGYITFMLIYCFVSWMICIRSFSMINELPDKVLRWLQIQSTANPDDGQRYVTGNVVMGLQRTGAATSAALGAVTGPGKAAVMPARAISGALPGPGIASKIPFPK